jgi:trans-aconitate methyltransferase
MVGAKPTGDPREWDATTYHKVSQPQVGWGQAVLERLAALGLRGDEVIVDAGCGSGRLTAQLLDRWPRVRVIAVDGSRNMLEAAGAHLARFGDRVSFVRADLQSWSGEDAADVVFSTATFHWIKDHPTLFANLFRFLRPGGWLLAQCGGAGNIARQHARAEALLREEPFARYFTGWVAPWEFASADETRSRLVAAGFHRVETSVESAPVVLASPAEFREFVATVILGPHLARLPDEATRALFVERMTDLAAVDSPPFLLDYMRLNMRAQRG